MKEREAAQTASLEKDSVVKDAIETNPYTNPSGKGIVHTKAAGEIENTPRELGGEERTRKGH